MANSRRRGREHIRSSRIKTRTRTRTGTRTRKRKRDKKQNRMKTGYIRRLTFRSTLQGTHTF